MIQIDPIEGLTVALLIGASFGSYVGRRRAAALAARRTAFEAWWSTTGSAMRPGPAEDAEAHARRVAAHAWDAGFAQRDAA